MGVGDPTSEPVAPARATDLQSPAAVIIPRSHHFELAMHCHACDKRSHVFRASPLTYGCFSLLSTRIS